MVIGAGGAGKTTVAREIAAATGLPLVHLDRLFWQPGWVRTPTAEWHRPLDVPRLRCLARIVKRALLNRRRTRDDMTPGCPERVTWEFVRWVWSYPTMRRPHLLTKLKAFEAEGGRVVVFRADHDTRELLSAIRPRRLS